MPEIIERAWHIKIRYLILILLVSFVLSIYFGMPGSGDNNGDPLSEVSSEYIIYISLFLLLYILAKKSSLDWKRLTGKFNYEFITGKYIFISLPLLVLSIGGIYLLFYPLSVLSPDFVNEWLFTDESNLIWFSGNNYKLANILSFTSVVLIAPVLEEIFFRGFLLTSISCKYNINKAIIVSSVIFGFFHTDILGAALFGVVLSIIYLKTRSLFAPVIIHICNNAIVFIASYFFMVFKEKENYTVANFQNDWWIGAIALITGVCWLTFF